MSAQFHGITSIGLTLIAIVIALVAMFQTSWEWGVVYLAACIVAVGIILYVYCARCPCREKCGHVFLGRLAAALVERQPGPYTVVELAALLLALLLLWGLPQVWLWRYTGLFVAFWVLSAIALTQIRIVVCRNCGNVYCPANPRRS